MKYDFRDLPEKTVRKEENAYFLYRENGGGVKVTVYHKYTKVLNVSVNVEQRTVSCHSTPAVTYSDLYEVEKLLKGILPEEVLLLKILEKALKSQEGMVIVNY